MTGDERFWTKVERTDGCWLWTAGKSANGYGLFWLDGSTKYAHRVSYELARGPAPEGLDLDHLCRVRHCVNPDHLEPVSRRVNASRGVAGAVNGARMLARTHCSRGHLYSAKNTALSQQGHRVCRACHREDQRRYLARKKAQNSDVA